jgi:hypothetical protein
VTNKRKLQDITGLACQEEEKAKKKDKEEEMKEKKRKEEAKLHHQKIPYWYSDTAKEESFPKGTFNKKENTCQ